MEIFDHHCPWLGKCIGKRNYFYFIFYLISQNLLLISVLVISAVEISNIARTESPSVGHPLTTGQARLFDLLQRVHRYCSGVPRVHRNSPGFPFYADCDEQDHARVFQEYNQKVGPEPLQKVGMTSSYFRTVKKFCTSRNKRTYTKFNVSSLKR